MSIVNKGKYIIPIATSLLVCLLYILFIDYISVPWCDEAGTVDTSINVLTKHKWFSNVWPYSYNLLHAFLYVGWLKLWGISRVTICSMDIFFMFIASALLINILIKRVKVENIVLLIAFVLLFLGSYHMFLISTSARIDPLAIIFAVLLADSIFQKKGYVKLFFYSFFLFASATYPLPLFGFFLLFVIITNKNERLENIKKLFLVIAGTCSAFFLICLFYYYHHFLYNYIGTFFYFSSTGYKGNFLRTLFDNYMYNPEALMILFLTAVLLYRNSGSSDIKPYFWFVACIPLLMTLFGHYVPYYSWMLFVPAILFFFYLIRNQQRSRCILVLFFSFMLAVFSITVKMSKYQTIRKDVTCFNQYFKNTESNDFVFVNNYHAYYSLFQKNNIYCINSGLEPREHDAPIINNGLINVPIHVSEDMDFFTKGVLKETPYYTIPSEGYFIIDNSVISSLPVLEKLYNVKCEKEKEFSLSTLYKYNPIQSD